MQDNNSVKLLFVINPVSGGKNKNDWETEIKNYFENRPHNIDFFSLKGKDDMIAIKEYIEQTKPSKIVAVGGDGTLKMVVEIVIGTDLVAGVLPAGSANGMAKELNIPADKQEALKIIEAGKTRKIDAIKINNEQICFHLSDLGLNAMLVKYFEKSGSRGMWGYGKAVLKVLWGKKNIHATIKTDQGSINRKAYMIVIANARTYGTGAIINPEGEINDGLFEIVIIRKLSIWELFKMLVTHNPFDNECIEVFQTKSLELTTRSKTYFQVDGEFLGKRKMVTATIIPQSVNIMLP